MFTVLTMYQIFFVLLGAASVRGYCWITPDENGVVNIPDGLEQIPESVSTNEPLPSLNIFSISDRILRPNRLPLPRHLISVMD